MCVLLLKNTRWPPGKSGRRIAPLEAAAHLQAPPRGHGRTTNRWSHRQSRAIAAAGPRHHGASQRPRRASGAVAERLAAPVPGKSAENGGSATDLLRRTGLPLALRGLVRWPGPPPPENQELCAAPHNPPSHSAGNSADPAGARQAARQKIRSVFSPLIAALPVVRG